MRELNYLCKKSAFTLAEVLITLGVIGVVASLTLPTLIQNYQKQVTVNQLKKAYSEISQAIELSELHNGELEHWQLTLPHEEFADKYLVPYLKVTEKIPSWDWVDELNYTDLNGIKVTKSHDGANGTALKLADGMVVFVDKWFPDDNSFRTLYIDINGAKKPNIWGKDLFSFAVKNSGVAPLRIDRTRENLLGLDKYACNKEAVQGGLWCSAVIVQDGWKIEKDYPW